MGPSEVAKVAPPSSGGLFPRIARAEVLLDGRRFEPRSLPPLPPGGTRVPPHPPSGRRFILHTYTKVARSLQQQLLGTSPPWWAVQDLNLQTSSVAATPANSGFAGPRKEFDVAAPSSEGDRKSTRLNSSHLVISY